ncbi:uncharacterized protein TrAFT101_004204 [Trichoderma asperellum]|uniref:uncharacterized protein n=1 Tax=Trichoderma asperellum TaxID=101201 RepID=UPI00332DF5E1|nr:hypothetical protein TrAFT101_004204 [Trichoderma asperellum]
MYLTLGSLQISEAALSDAANTKVGDADMACARLPSTTSVMVSRILKWLPSHIRLEKYMVRDWARLGSTVEKKKKLRRWFKREGESDEKKKGKGEKKKFALPCCSRAWLLH